MTIGDVFAKAWELWRRDVGWLILAGLVVGVIIGVIAIIVVAIVAGMAAVSIGGIAVGSNTDSAGLTGVGIGTLIGAAILGIIGYLIISVLAMAFYGGMFNMVIGAAREHRGVEFGELFSGFRKFPSFLVFWLVMAGIGIVCGLVFLIPVLGWIAVPIFLAWLTTTWLYVLPLIADRGLTFGEAASTSRAMVRNVGWWKTFGVIIVLGIAFAVIGFVISLIQRESNAAGTVLMFIFEILAFPFAICYVSTMYLQAGSEQAGLPAGAYAPSPGPSPFAPPPPRPARAPTAACGPSRGPPRASAGAAGCASGHGAGSVGSSSGAARVADRCSASAGASSGCGRRHRRDDGRGRGRGRPGGRGGRDGGSARAACGGHGGARAAGS
jgi:hypothetical protein